jgi:hypothetical protein
MAVFIEMVIAFAETMDDFIRPEPALEIDSHDFAIRIKAEGNITGTNLGDGFSNRIQESNREWFLDDDYFAVGSSDCAGI